jgi:hypothetical protein
VAGQLDKQSACRNAKHRSRNHSPQSTLRRRTVAGRRSTDAATTGRPRRGGGATARSRARSNTAKCARYTRKIYCSGHSSRALGLGEGLAINKLLGRTRDARGSKLARVREMPHGYMMWHRATQNRAAAEHAKHRLEWGDCFRRKRCRLTGTYGCITASRRTRTLLV